MWAVAWNVECCAMWNEVECGHDTQQWRWCYANVISGGMCYVNVISGGMCYVNVTSGGM